MEGCEFSKEEQPELQEVDWEEQGQKVLRRDEDWEIALPEISLHATTRSPNPRTMRLIGTVTGVDNFD